MEYDFFFVLLCLITSIGRMRAHFVKDPIPIRKGRSFKRVRKNVQSKSKHKTFTNFKPSY